MILSVLKCLYLYPSNNWNKWMRHNCYITANSKMVALDLVLLRQRCEAPSRQVKARVLAVSRPRRPKAGANRHDRIKCCAMLRNM